MDTTQTLITIGTTIATTLAAKGIESPGKSLGNLWDIAIGNKIAAAYEKSKFKHNLDVEDFKNKLINNVSSIKKENLQEPKISIVGPALEASKYYFEEEEIRDMFANLIASSMDSTYNGIVQHSFVEIIKQLSPHDAKLLSFFSKSNALIDIRIESEDGEGIFLLRNIYFTDSFPEYKINTISLLNLEKQGLIKLDDNRFLSDKSLYDYYENSPLVLELKKQYDNKHSISFSGKIGKIKIVKKMFFITELGKAFKEVCVKDSL